MQPSPVGATRRVAVVTGGAGAIGQATAEKLAGQGFDIHLIDRNGTALEAARERVEAVGARCLTTNGDVMQAEHVDQAIAACIAALGRIDALVNIAGGAGPVRAYQVDEISDSVWHNVMDLNVTSTLFLLPCRRADHAPPALRPHCGAVLDHCIRRKRAHPTRWPHDCPRPLPRRRCSASRRSSPRTSARTGSR